MRQLLYGQRRILSTLFWLLLLAGMASCRRDPSQFEINTLSGAPIGAFGHGGMGLHYTYPMNSESSIKACMDAGADGIELDIQISRDGVPVLYHGERLEHGTNMNGILNSFTREELRQARYNSAFSDNLELPDLEKIFAAHADGRRIFTLDCKPFPREGMDETQFNREFALALTMLIARYNLQQFVFVESHSIEFLTLMQEMDPSLKLWIYSGDFATGLKIADDLHLYGITTERTKVDASMVQIAHAHGHRVTLFGAGTANHNIEVIALSPDYIQSDKLTHLLKVFDKYQDQGWKDPLW